jgi:hypothetical protein
MGNSEVNDETAESLTPIEPKAPTSKPFERIHSAPPSQGVPPARRSSIRPAPASFKPTLRDNSKLPPPMVVHAGEAEKDVPAWGDPELPSYPSHVKVDKPTHSEPFALAEDLHLETLPLDLPKAPGLPHGLTKNAGAEAQGGAESATPPALVSDNSGSEKNVAPTVGQGVGVESVVEVSPPLSVRNLMVTEPSLRVKKKATGARRTPLLSVAGAVILVGLGVAVFAGRGHKGADSADVAHHEKGPSEGTPTVGAHANPKAVEPAVPVPPSEPAVVQQVPEEATAPSAANSNSDAPTSGSAKSAVNPDANVVPVTVKLIPADAKLVFRGVAVEGPPFVIEVPKGKKLSMEASRRGFVTRKITIDSTKDAVTFGLIADKKHR